MKRRSLEVWRSPLHRATVWHLESRGTQKVIGSCVRTHTPVARAAKIDAFWTARKAGQLALRNIIRCHGEARPRASRHDWMERLEGVVAPLTMFTWGYWGWGTTTREFVQAADAVEASRGFNPPLFVDIRIRRSVRAPGFTG